MTGSQPRAATGTRPLPSRSPSGACTRVFGASGLTSVLGAERAVPVDGDVSAVHQQQALAGQDAAQQVGDGRLVHVRLRLHGRDAPPAVQTGPAAVAPEPSPTRQLTEGDGGRGCDQLAAPRPAWAGEHLLTLWLRLLCLPRGWNVRGDPAHSPRQPAWCGCLAAPTLTPPSGSPEVRTWASSRLGGRAPRRATPLAARPRPHTPGEPQGDGPGHGPVRPQSRAGQPPPLGAQRGRGAGRGLLAAAGGHSPEGAGDPGPKVGDTRALVRRHPAGPARHKQRLPHLTSGDVPTPTRGREGLTACPAPPALHLHLPRTAPAVTCPQGPAQRGLQTERGGRPRCPHASAPGRGPQACTRTGCRPRRSASGGPAPAQCDGGL